MQIQLNQKERMLLEDEKLQEEICIVKYKNYSQQAQDPQLKQLFNTLSTEEQHLSICLTRCSGAAAQYEPRTAGAESRKSTAAIAISGRYEQCR